MEIITCHSHPWGQTNKQMGSTEGNLAGSSDHKFWTGQVLVVSPAPAYNFLVKGLSLP